MLDNIANVKYYVTVPYLYGYPITDTVAVSIGIQREETILKRPPDWAISARARMFEYGITLSDISKRIDRSPQMISNIMTGYYTSAKLEKTVRDCVDQIISEKGGDRQ